MMIIWWMQTYYDFFSFFVTIQSFLFNIPQCYI